MFVSYSLHLSDNLATSYSKPDACLLSKNLEAYQPSNAVLADNNTVKTPPIDPFKMEYQQNAAEHLNY
jgi:hypothetical protein